VNIGALFRSSASTANKSKKSPSRPTVIGTSNANNRVKVVDTERKVDTLVSRLDPHTDVNELVDCVDSIKGDIDVHRP